MNSLERRGASLARIAVAQPLVQQVVELWPQNRPAVTYWILLVSGLNEREQVGIAQALLVWNAFLSREVAQVACFDSRDPVVDALATRYALKGYPSLILGTEPELNDALVIGPGVLKLLINEDQGLQTFFANVQLLLQGNGSLSAVKDTLNRKKFWDGFKTGWKELKSVLSVTLQSPSGDG